jgi:hypothetical protein
MAFFIKYKKQSKFHMEAQKTHNNQSNPRQKEQYWSYYNNLFQIILYSHSNKNSTHTHTHTHTDEYIGGLDRGPRSKPMQLSHMILDQGTKNISWAKDNCFNK